MRYGTLSMRLRHASPTFFHNGRFGPLDKPMFCGSFVYCCFLQSSTDIAIQLRTPEGVRQASGHMLTRGNMRFGEPEACYVLPGHLMKSRNFVLSPDANRLPVPPQPNNPEPAIPCLTWGAQTKSTPPFRMLALTQIAVGIEGLIKLDRLWRPELSCQGTHRRSKPVKQPSSGRRHCVC